MSTSQDDVSLRDLYLIVRQGLPLIIIVALLAGLITLTITTLLPKTFRATAIVQITPSPIDTPERNGLAYNPRGVVTFDGYSNLAGSSAVLRTSLDAIDESDLTMRTFILNSEVVELVGPQRPDQDALLMVEHSIKGDDPEIVAALTEAWALTTLEQAQASQIAELESLQNTTAAALELRRSSLQLSEDSWEAFQAGDDRPILRGRLAALNTRISAAGDHIDELDRDIATVSARQAFLAAQLAAASNDDSTSALNQLDALTTADFISEQIASQLRILLANRPDLVEGLEANLLTVMLGAELQQEMTLFISHQAEQVFLEQQLTSYEARAETLRGQIAKIDTQAVRLERQLGAAQQAYGDVAHLEPLLAFVSELTITSGRLLRSVVVPESPQAARRLMSTVVATLLAAFLTLLYLFMREAITEPVSPEGVSDRDPDSGLAPSESRQPAGSTRTKRET